MKKIVPAFGLCWLLLSGFMFSHAQDQTPPEDAAPAAAASSSDTEDWSGKVVVVPVHGAMMWSPLSGHSKILDGVKEAFARIKDQPPRLVVVEVDSLGGSVLTCGLISEQIMQCKVPTVALVLKEAISGGALVSISCNEIDMVKGSRIGDVQPMPGYSGGQPIDERAEEKMESYVRGVMEAHGEASGYPTRLLRAMVSRDVELYRIAFDDGERVFRTKKELEVLQDNIENKIETRKITSKELVVKEGDLLVLSPNKAKEYGLAKNVVADVNEFYTVRSIDSRDVIRADVVAGDENPSTLKDLKDLDWGVEPWVVVLLAILLTIGVAGAIAEAQMPGFGVPGTLGIIGFSSFFVVLAMAGNVEWYEIALFVAGIALLVVEIVLLPGFGVAGAAGVVFLLGGLFLAFMPDFAMAPDTGAIWQQAGFFLLMLTGSFVGIFLLVYLTVVYGERIPGVQFFYLRASLKGGREVMEEVKAAADLEAQEEKHDPHAHLIGKTGVATTSLRPAGKVCLDDGTLLDVVTEGGLIEVETRVRVRETRMNRIVVEPIQG